MRQLRLGILVASLILESCNTVRGATRDVPPSPTGTETCPAGYYVMTGLGCLPNAGAAVGAVVPALAAAYSPVGRLITRDANFVAEGGGYAIVLLKRGYPERAKQACDKMARSMAVRVGPSDGRPIVMDGSVVFERPVYWPVMARTATNCADMLKNYDFERAMLNYQRIPRSSRLGQGPFVVVRRKGGQQYGLFDFSNLAGQDFGEQFEAVVNYMSQREDVWNPAFYRQATIRQTMRYYVLERAGEGPMVVASLFGKKA